MKAQLNTKIVSLIPLQIKLILHFTLEKREDRGGSKTIKVVHLVMIKAITQETGNQNIRIPKGKRITIYTHRCQLTQATTLNFLNHSKCIICKAFLMECLLWLTLWIHKWPIMHLSFYLRCKQWHTCNNNNIWITCISRCNKCKFPNSSNKSIWIWHKPHMTL